MIFAKKSLFNKSKFKLMKKILGFIANLFLTLDSAKHTFQRAGKNTKFFKKFK